MWSLLYAGLLQSWSIIFVMLLNIEVWWRGVGEFLLCRRCRGCKVCSDTLLPNRIIQLPGYSFFYLLDIAPPASNLIKLLLVEPCYNQKLRHVERPPFREASSSALAVMPKADPPRRRIQNWTPPEREGLSTAIVNCNGSLPTK